MRALVVTQNTTVDGVVEATEDWFGVAGGVGNDDLDAVLAAQRDASDGFLVGRDTYVSMRESWGRMTDDTTGVADHLNRVAKYVVSTSMTTTDWDNSEILGGVDEVRGVKERPGGDIVCTGSISLCHALAAAGLVDEYRLFVFPFARGSGRRLFDGTPPVHLRLVEQVTFRSGALMVRYRTD